MSLDLQLWACVVSKVKGWNSVSAKSVRLKSGVKLRKMKLTDVERKWLNRIINREYRE